MFPYKRLVVLATGGTRFTPFLHMTSWGNTNYIVFQCLSLLTTDEQQLKFNYNKNKVIVYRYALFRVIKINI